MLRIGAFIGKTGVLTAGKINSGFSVNLSRKLKAIRDQSTVDCCDSVTIPHCDPPRERCMMDLLPIPCDPWQDYYDRENEKNSKFLLYSVGAFIFTCLCVNQIGFVKGYPEVRLFT